jgi:lipopolysaccharide export system protein LptC
LSTVTQIAGSDARSYMRSRRDIEGVFRAAVRHSRFVRTVRVALPLAVVLGCGASYALLAWHGLANTAVQMPVSTEGLSVSATKIMMQQPRLAGFTRDARRYLVTARSAAQDIAKPDSVELFDIHATMTTRDQGDIEVTARNGVYDGKTEKLTLQNSIVLRTPSYEVLLKQAVVGVRNGHVVSEQPVAVKMLRGTVTANRLEVIDSGDVIRFDGGVDLLLDADAIDKQALSNQATTDTP